MQCDDTLVLQCKQRGTQHSRAKNSDFGYDKGRKHPKYHRNHSYPRFEEGLPTLPVPAKKWRWWRGRAAKTQLSKMDEATSPSPFTIYAGSRSTAVFLINSGFFDKRLDVWMLTSLHGAIYYTSRYSQDNWQKMMGYWRVYAAGLATTLLGMTIVLVVDSFLVASRGEFQVNIVHIKDFGKSLVQ